MPVFFSFYLGEKLLKYKNDKNSWKDILKGYHLCANLFLWLKYHREIEKAFIFGNPEKFGFLVFEEVESIYGRNEAESHSMQGQRYSERKWWRYVTFISIY